MPILNLYLKVCNFPLLGVYFTDTLVLIYKYIVDVFVVAVVVFREREESGTEGVGGGAK